MKAMARAIKEQTGSGVRQGTATRRAGRETAARLVAAAHEQLEVETLERFSMRNVAERAGVSLANLQYYFPRREDLLRALYQDLDTRYRAAYEEVLAQAPDDPVERFQAVLEYNMKDISKRSTRQFFMQLWALLGSIDNGFLNACAFRGILSSSFQNNLRRQIASLLASRIPSRETSSLATALLSGERGKLPSRIRELFRRTGISHLLAVSGLHVGFITAALLLLFRKLAGRSVLSVLLVILLMSFYVFLAGARASTVRAGIMGGIVLVCFQARGRIPDFRAIWSAAVICILIVSGMEVLADVGAQMSFSAVLSLAIMGRTFSMPFGRILSILYAGFIVTLALAPLVFSVYGSLSPVAPLATLLSMPFMLATMLLGILTLAAGSILPGIPVLLEWTVYLWLKTVKLLDLGLMNSSKWMIPIWVSAIVILVLLSRRGRFFRRFS